MSTAGYVYILKSAKDNKIYIGSTRNLDNRIKQHNYGKVKSTKARRPLKLIYHELCSNYSDARKRENFLKSGAGRNWLKINNLI